MNRFRAWISSLKNVSMAEIDYWWTGYVVAIPGIAGSWLSFMFFGAGIWAVTCIAFRRFPIDIPSRAFWFVFSCLGYALAMLASSVINDGTAGIGPGLAAGAAFYFVPFIISRYRFSDPGQAVELMVGYAPLGAVLCLVSALYQAVVIGSMIEGGTGNASVFGFVAALLGALSLANGHSQSAYKRALAIVGFLAGMATLIMSNTRALFPVILLVPLTFVLLTSRMPVRNSRTLLLSFIAAAGIATILFGPRLASNIARIIDEFANVRDDAIVTSLEIRVELWKAAVVSIEDAFWLGFGQVHKMDEVFDKLPEMISYVRFSHVHNAWIDSLLSGGIIGFIFFNAIFLSIFRISYYLNKNDVDLRKKYIIISVVFISILNSLFNTMFTHDILVCIFLIPILLILATETRSKHEGHASSLIEILN